MPNTRSTLRLDQEMLDNPRTLLLVSPLGCFEQEADVFTMSEQVYVMLQFAVKGRMRQVGQIGNVVTEDQAAAIGEAIDLIPQDNGWQIGLFMLGDPAGDGIRGFAKFCRQGGFEIRSGE